MSRISNNSPEFTDDDSDYIEDSLHEKTSYQFRSDNSDYCIEDSIQDMSSLKIEDDSDLDDTTGLPITPIKTKSKKKTAIIDSDSEEDDTNVGKDDKSSTAQCTENFPKSPEGEHYDLYRRSSNFKVRPTDLNNTSDSPLARTKNKQKIAVIDSDSDSEDELKTNDKLPNSAARIQRKSKGLEIDSDSESEGELHDWNPESDNLRGHHSGFDETFESPIAKVGNKLRTNIIDSDSEEDSKTSTKPLVSNREVRHKSLDSEKTPKDLDSHPSEEELHSRYSRSDTDSSRCKPKTVNRGTPIKERPVEFRKESMLTPRIPRQVSISSESSLEELRDEENIIDISSDEETKTPAPVAKKFIGKQITLDKLVQKLQVENNKTPPSDVKEEDPGAVSPETYNKQVNKVRQLESDLQKAKNLLQTLNINALPDKGELLLKRHSYLENILKIEKETLSKMVCRKDMMQCAKKAQIASWEEIEAGASAVQPKTFGKKGIQTYNAQKAMTLDRLEQLHSSLKGRPSDNTQATDPKGLKVSLMPHQKTALAWMMWREQQKPSGGILADDMGLGKTLTMISLMLKTNERKNKEDDDDDSDDESNKARKNYKYPGGTLVVCPASLLNQWSGELERRTSRGLASHEVYHGPKRETKPKRLGEYDMVITTYAIVLNECEKNGAIFRVRWRRIILDEAHQIRNHKSQTSEAVCKLSGKSRWALTGTPVHNRELDMYALLKFLKCTPFDDLVVWKRWVGDKSTGGQERLHTVISSLLLRRTKAELMKKGALQCLPERKWELIPVTLEKNEMDIYSKVLMFSRTLFAQYLHQHAEKNQGKVDFDLKTMPNGPNSEYFKMRQMLLKYNNIRDVKQHEILVLLLRLRQICCHPCLITGMLQGDEDLGVEDDSENIGEINLLEQLNKLNLDDQDHDPASNIGQEQVGLKEACKGLLNPSNPVFANKTRSSKIRVIMNVIKKNVIANNDKAIVVSQWTSLLRIIALHLEKEGIRFEQLDGSVPVHKRMAIVDNINNPNHKIKILLLSLTAGGVGLNLVGANHLLLLDLHWNPQLESQAQDRIYRVGQNKPVYIYKFMAVGTIEERIKHLQDKKLEIAESMLSGTKQVISSKLTLNDLKMLFEM